MLNIPHGTTLAFDFGETRIGVAQGDAEVGIAHPLATISGEGNDKKFAAIAALYWADERLTSLYAAELLNQNGLRGRKQKPVLDQVAAQAILQGFFEGGWVEEFHG